MDLGNAPQINIYPEILLHISGIMGLLDYKLLSYCDPMCWHFSSASNLITGDVISQQFENFLHTDAKGLDFISFSPAEECRVNVFLHQRMGGSYPDLWTFCKNLLLLSHGQAEVEHGFSTNKEVETCNLTEEGIVAQRFICDHVRVCGGVTKVPLIKRWSVTVPQHAPGTEHTWMRRGVKRKKERSKKEKDDRKKKRKNLVEELEDLKRQRRSLEGVCESLQTDADQMAEKAENSAGTKMATLITKSNTLRRRAKEKREQLVVLNADIEKKATELRCLTDQQ